jgi:hypothetical protein
MRAISGTFDGHPFRQYGVLHCSQLFGIHSEIKGQLRSAILAGSQVFSSVRAVIAVTAQGELIFTNPDGGEFSENAMLAVLDRLG